MTQQRRHTRTARAPRAWLALAASLATASAGAQAGPGGDAEHARIYTTREERRDAGVKHELLEGVTVSGLLELEGLRQRTALRDDPARNDDDAYTTTLQAALELEPVDWIKAEVIWELEDESGMRSMPPQLDEAFVAVEFGDFELEAGRLFMPFGEYFSHFVSGPMLEFGETGGRGAVLSWSPDDRLELAAYTYRGRARPEGQRRRDWDWGAALELAPFSFGTFAVSYLSDLADSDERLLQDSGDRHARQVPAWSAYASLGAGDLELTFETVRALDSFRELDPDRDRPEAWNAELAWFPLDTLQIALRAEGSREFEDAPEFQSGVALAWGFARIASVTVEFLQGRFSRGFAEDPFEREVDDVSRVGAQLAVEL